MPIERPLPTRRATVSLGQELASLLTRGDLVLLEGPLGAGKTYLTRALLRSVGVPHETPVTSPTFSLVHEYEVRLPAGPARLLHADLYRLDRPGDVAELGLREARGEGAVLLVEWGERFEAELGGRSIGVRLAVDEGPRRAELTGLAVGPAGALERAPDTARAARGGAAHG
jgi:tRNA threonylcarbamoyladenosine biosynthesis protein TsaE